MTPDERANRRRSPLTALGAGMIVLASVTPFIDFIGRNQQLVRSPWRALSLATVTALIALAIASVITTVARRSDRDAVAAGTATLVLSTFYFSVAFGDEPGANPLLDVALWTLGTVAMVSFVQWLAHRPLAMTFFVVWVAALFVVSTATYISARPPAEVPLMQTDGAIDNLPASPAVRTPDIYWFVLDEYGRADQLERVTGQQVQDVTDDLDERGFATSRSSWASYARTHQSLASTVSGDLVGGKAVVNDFLEYGAVSVGNNATVRRLRTHGYTYAHADPGGLDWLACNTDFADICLPPAKQGIALDEQDDTLLRRTPLAALLPTTRPYTDPVQVLDELDERRDEIDGPLFLFAHVLSPHGPFRYNDDCSLRADFLVTEQLSEERIDAYLQELPCVNALLLEAVDRIISEDPEAIIIVQSDHGSALGMEVSFTLDELTDSDIQERFAVINAMRLPAPCATDLEGEPLVDTFHIVFACLEGRTPTSVPWKAYYSEEDSVGDVIQLAPERFETRSAP